MKIILGAYERKKGEDNLDERYDLQDKPGPAEVESERRGEAGDRLVH